MISAEALSLLSDLIVIATALVGGGFAFYRFRLSRETEAILEFTITPTRVCTDANSLIAVTITVKNTGKTATFVPEKQFRECLCHIRRVKTPPEEGVINWDSLATEEVCKPVAYMSDWVSGHEEEPMVFEPGASDHFHVIFTTHPTGTLWLRAVLVDKDKNKWRADRFLELGRASGDQARGPSEQGLAANSEP